MVRVTPRVSVNPDSAGTATSGWVPLGSTPGFGVGLYTILPSPILYGVWHTEGGSVRGSILRNGRAIVLQ